MSRNARCSNRYIYWRFDKVFRCHSTQKLFVNDFMATFHGNVYKLFGRSMNLCAFSHACQYFRVETNKTSVIRDWNRRDESVNIHIAAININNPIKAQILSIACNNKSETGGEKNMAEVHEHDRSTEMALQFVSKCGKEPTILDANFELIATHY